MKEDAFTFAKIRGGFWLDFGAGRVGTITDAQALTLAKAVLVALKKKGE
jgi:hypothetical protein